VEKEHTYERGMMRKSKRSIIWEEPPSGSSNRKLDAKIDDLDEEIIDLEEIVGPHAEALEEEDELAFDVEILDAETDHGFGSFESKFESEEEFLLEDDLLKELPFFQELKAEAKPPQETGIAREKAEEFALELLVGSAEGALEEPAGSAEASAPEAMKPDEIAFGSMLETGEDVLEEAAGGGELLAAEDAKPEDHTEPITPPAEASVSLDGFVAQIESRLVDAVREIVESRLPEIVRTVLREEIERLKNDQEPEA
jgi:hypothetical protein